MKEFLKSIAFRVLVLVAALLVGMMVYAASVGGVSTSVTEVGTLMVARGLKIL